MSRKKKEVCIRTVDGARVCGTPVRDARSNPRAPKPRSMRQVRSPYSIAEAEYVGTMLGLNWKREARRGITPELLARGMQSEAEHSRPRGSVTDALHGDPLRTAQVALAHLRERPDYYELLEVLEEAD